MDVREIRALVREAEKRLAELRPRAARLEARIARGPLRDPARFYDLARAVAEMKRERTYVYLGHGSFRAWLAAARPMSRAAAYRLLLVAEHLTRAQAERLGLERSVAVAGKIARGEPVPADAAALSARAIAGRAPVDPRAVRVARRLSRALGGRAEARRRGRGSEVVVTLGVEDAERLAALLTPAAPRTRPARRGRGTGRLSA